MVNATCQNCGSAQSLLYKASDENRRLSKEIFHWVRCGNCGLISLADPPADLGRYYDGGYYEIPDEERLDQLAARENSKMAAIMPYAKSGRLLEIGPAIGAFSRRASRAGFKVTVIERDARCCEHLRVGGGIDVINADDPVAAMEGLEPFAVIALWHVIEHLRNPFEFLDAAARVLRPGGLLVLAAPNPEAWQFTVMGSRWPHLDAPRHLHILPAQALVENCARLGLEKLRLVTDDEDARSWNRFGWQRMLMNRLPGRLGQIAGFVAGAILSALFSPFECGPMRGSAYTLTFQKR